MCLEHSDLSVCLYVYGLLSFVIYYKTSIATLFVWQLATYPIIVNLFIYFEKFS